MFWDASALVPLAFTEPRSPDVVALAGNETAVVVWWATTVECQAAGYRRHREGHTRADDLKTGLR